MTFDLVEARAIWERTPRAVDALLRDLPDGWVRCDEGAGTFSPYDVVGHFVHGERTDWIPRTRIILDSGGEFTAFDRFAQREASEGKSMNDLLDEFAAVRAANLQALDGFALGPAELSRTGGHPELGQVTLAELLATWVAHDLAHVRQIVRVMAKRYRYDVGPWVSYMPVMGE